MPRQKRLNGANKDPAISSKQGPSWWRHSLKLGHNGLRRLYVRRCRLGPNRWRLVPGRCTHLAESGGDFLELCQGDEPVPVPVKDLESRPKVLTSNPSCSDVELDVVQIYSCLCVYSCIAVQRSTLHVYHMERAVQDRMENCVPIFFICVIYCTAHCYLYPLRSSPSLCSAYATSVRCGKSQIEKKT